jgi:POT family proton-dependent oligopeptide transporter
LTLGPRSLLGHPRGLATVFLLEMWERLSFYGMRALLVLFLVHSAAEGGLGLDVRSATAIYGLYVSGTYIASLPGGWAGDRIFGAQRAVLLGGLIITTGHLLLGFAGSAPVFFLGLLVIVLGTGLLKPNATSLVAQLYPTGGAALDAGFTFYYVGVNVGATLGPFLTGAMAARYGWPYGFMTAAAGMVLGVLQFLWTRRWLGDAGARPPAPSSRGAGGLALGLAVLAVATALLWSGRLHPAPAAVLSASTGIIAAIAVLYFLYLLFGAGLDAVERRRIGVVMLLFVAATLFWGGFEQSGSSFNLFAERYTERDLHGFQVPAAWFQSLEPVFIIVLGPLLGALWVQLGRRGLDPSIPHKFVIGLLGMGLGFVVLALAARRVIAGTPAGMGALVLTYLLQTIGELALSPVGLSAVSKLVPRRFIGQSLGVWFVSLSLGELLAGRLAGDFDPSQLASFPGQFMRVFWYSAACAVALAGLAPLMRRWMAGVR